MPPSDGIYLSDLRESWIFVLMGSDESRAADAQGCRGDAGNNTLDYWEVGVGNSESLVETIAGRVGCNDVRSEGELVDELMAELGEYRYQETVLITPDLTTIQSLRRQLAQTSVDRSSLRGFRHVALEELLKRYFDQALREYEFQEKNRPSPRTTEEGPESVVSNGGVQEFWELWLRVYSLLPANEVMGDPL